MSCPRVANSYNNPRCDAPCIAEAQPPQADEATIDPSPSVSRPCRTAGIRAAAAHSNLQASSQDAAEVDEIADLSGPGNPGRPEDDREVSVSGAACCL